METSVVSAPLVAGMAMPSLAQPLTIGGLK